MRVAGSGVLAATLAATLFCITIAGCAADTDPEPTGTGTPGQTDESPAEPVAEEPVAGFTLSSSAFADGGTIPARYCLESVDGGQNISIPVDWSGAPAGTASFVVSMIDTHPVANDWVHWIVIDLPATTTGLPEGASDSAIPDVADELDNTFGEDRYGGPAPPPGSGDHEYVVTVYALDVATIAMPEQPSAADIASAVEGHVLASVSVTGVFGR